MEKMYTIKLDSGAKYQVRADENLSLHTMDWCIIRKEFYLDYGQVVKALTISPDDAAGKGNDKKSIPRIQRKATVLDKSKANENRMRAKSALRTAYQHVESLGLEMKLLNAHYSFDSKFITIQFTADGRVDFRELVKQLSQVLNARIELRQIGVRDETAIHGGLGICGRELCCSAFLKEFASINVKMAKEQDLSLTMSSISGACGRLKCCLKYEHAGYLELEKTMPRRGAYCECEEGRGRIVDRNLLTQTVVVHLDNSSRYISCPRSEIRVMYLEKYKLPKKGQEKKGSGDKKERENRQGNKGKKGKGKQNKNKNTPNQNNQKKPNDNQNKEGDKNSSQRRKGKKRRPPKNSRNNQRSDKPTSDKNKGDNSN